VCCRDQALRYLGEVQAVGLFYGCQQVMINRSDSGQRATDRARDSSNGVRVSAYLCGVEHGA
jgi:hypothetical protein